MSEKRKCLECQSELFGRIDKKFCSDHCRSMHYNRKNSHDNAIIRETNIILRKNYRVLKSLAPSGKIKVSEKKLLENGFRLNYFTNLYTTKKGLTYYFCYDMGIIKLEGDYYTIFEKKTFD